MAKGEASGGEVGRSFMSTALVAAEGRGLTSSRSCSPASLIRSTLACVDRIRVERQPCHPAIINTVVWLGHATPSGTPRPSPGRNVTSRGDSPFFPAPANADRSRRGQAAVICVPRPCARQPEEPARSPLGSPQPGSWPSPAVGCVGMSNSSCGLKRRLVGVQPGRGTRGCGVLSAS